MIRNYEKEKICKEYQDYIKLIYWFGKGVMMSVHLQDYMKQLKGKNKLQVWQEHRTLQSMDVIDIHKIHNNNYVKLKKYALRYLLNKNKAEDIKSVSYGFTAIKRTAFINAFILHYPLMGSSVDEMIEYYYNNTTLIAKHMQNTVILERYAMENKNIKNEIKNLDDINEKQIWSLKTKSVCKKIDKLSEFNLNNMQYRNIYISSIKGKTINVAFFDISDNYTAMSLSNVFEKTYYYLSMLFDDMKFTFTVVVSDISNKNRIYKQKEFLFGLLADKHILGQFLIGVKSIDIRAKVFSNVKILL